MEVDGHTQNSFARIHIENVLDNKSIYENDSSEDDVSSCSTIENESYSFEISEIDGISKAQVDMSFDELLEDSLYDSYCEENQKLRPRMLSPILEESEDAQSVISSVPFHCDFEEQSECNYLTNRNLSIQSSSFDSLASFEANEKRLLALESQTPNKESKKSEKTKLKNIGKRNFDEDKDILNYVLRRQHICPSRSPVNSPIASRTYYQSSSSGNASSKQKVGEEESTSEAKSTLILPSDDLNTISDKDLVECEDSKEASVNEHESVLINQATNTKDIEIAKTLSSQRTLSLDTLKRNDPSDKVKDVCLNYWADDDPLSAFEDRVVGYLNQRPREDSIFDLTSLHSKVFLEPANDGSSSLNGFDGFSSQSFKTNSEPMFSNEISSDNSGTETPKETDIITKSCTLPEKEIIKENKSRYENDVDDVNDNKDENKECDQDRFSDAQSVNSNDTFKNCSSSYESVNESATQTCESVQSKTSNQVPPTVCIFNDIIPIDIVSSYESEFHSCASSDSTSKEYNSPPEPLPVDDISSNPSYITPLQSTAIPDSEFETLTNGSEAGALPDTKLVLMPLSATLTSGATGYQTPPKYYYVIPPKFIGSKAEEVKVIRGRTAVLDCSIISHPEAKVAWYKDGRLMEIYDRISQHTSNDPQSSFNRNCSESSWNPPPLLPTEVDIDIGCVPQLDVHYLLKIKNAMAKDEGSYVCKAWNAAGVATKIIRLTVSNYYS